MKLLALDLSKSCTGFAIWHPGWERARLGHRSLGSEYSTNGDVFNALHKLLEELRVTIGFEQLFWERKLSAHKIVSGKTTQQTLDLLGGLDAYAEGYRAAYRMRGRPVAVNDWRQPFIGKDLDGTIKAATRRHNRIAKAGGGRTITSTDKLKAATMERARQLGFSPRNDGEADALGLLDYQLDLADIVPPWRQDEVLRAPLAVVA